jgi:hypothetical protein
MGPWFGVRRPLKKFDVQRTTHNKQLTKLSLTGVLFQSIVI